MILNFTVKIGYVWAYGIGYCVAQIQIVTFPDSALRRDHYQQSFSYQVKVVE